MINKKYYNDIKKFPEQFADGYKLASDIKINGNFERIVLCGMGGSSLYGDLLNDLFADHEKIDIRIETNQSYTLPKNVDEKTLILIASYSGNTEETVSCYQEALDKNLSHIVLTTGGKLEEIANKNDSTIYKIPRGLQPRLSTGYFIAGVIKMLMNMDLIPDVSRMVLDAASQISESLDEEKAKTTAKNLKNKVPILYSTFENKSIARISKIKFNENSKTQAFWYYFPELNHNEMVGFSNLIMDPYFIIMKSQYTHERNNKRMEIFKKLLEEKGAEVQIYEMSGDNILEEMLNAYYFIDHVTYYLSENYGIDPEPVDMVENFKKYMKE